MQSRIQSHNLLVQCLESVRVNLLLHKVVMHALLHMWHPYKEARSEPFCKVGYLTHRVHIYFVRFDFRSTGFAVDSTHSVTSTAAVPASSHRTPVSITRSVSNTTAVVTSLFMNPSPQFS